MNVLDRETSENGSGGPWVGAKEQSRRVQQQLGFAASDPREEGAPLPLLIHGLTSRLVISRDSIVLE